MLDEVGRPLRWNDAKERGLLFTEYFILLDIYKRMPNVWKQYFLHEDFQVKMTPLGACPTILIDGSLCPSIHVGKKCFYNMLVEKNNPASSTVFSRLKDQFGYEDDYVSQLFKLPWGITIDSKLRILQYKILNNLIPLNTWLVRIGKKSDSRCTFGCTCQESLVHLFFECPVSRKFWNEVGAIFRQLHLEELSADKIIYGIIDKQNNWWITNFLLLLGKNHILISKYKESKPNCGHFVSYVLYVEKVEKYIACRSNKLNVHLAKWSKLHGLMEIEG